MASKIGVRGRVIRVILETFILGIFGALVATAVRSALFFIGLVDEDE